MNNKSVLLCITGGISAYKIPFLVRLLKKGGFSVKIAVTPCAKRLVSTYTLEVLSQNRVLTDVFHDYNAYDIEHINIAKWADIIVVAPATANTIAKIKSGMADNIVTSLILARKRETPVLLCPAMNTNMWENPITQENITFLKNNGFYILGPESGALACGDAGKGRLVELENIFSEVEYLLSDDLFKGKRVIITAGPTREYIDDVRFITNLSSAKMGYSLAKWAYYFKADVSLISGPTCIKPVYGIKVFKVESACDMLDRLNNIKGDIYFFCAAVSDFKPDRFDGKIDKSSFDMKINLSLNPDIAREMRRKDPGAIMIGFAAEYGLNIKRAIKKLKNKGFDYIFLNDISDKSIGFQSDFNRGIFIRKDGKTWEFPDMSKDELAKKIISVISNGC